MVQYNLFAYCRNSPVLYVDRTGFYSFSEFFSDWKRGFKIIFKLNKKSKPAKKIITFTVKTSLATKKIKKIREAHCENLININSGKSYKLSKDMEYLDQNKYKSFCKKTYKNYYKSGICLPSYNDIKNKKWSKLSKKQKKSVYDSMIIWDKSFWYGSGGKAITDVAMDSTGILFIGVV